MIVTFHMYKMMLPFLLGFYLFYVCGTDEVFEYHVSNLIFSHKTCVFLLCIFAKKDDF